MFSYLVFFFASSFCGLFLWPLSVSFVCFLSLFMLPEICLRHFKTRDVAARPTQAIFYVTQDSLTPESKTACSWPLPAPTNALLYILFFYSEHRGKYSLGLHTSPPFFNPSCILSLFSSSGGLRRGILRFGWIMHAAKRLKDLKNEGKRREEGATFCNHFGSHGFFHLLASISSGSSFGFVVRE